MQHNVPANRGAVVVDHAAHLADALPEQAPGLSTCKETVAPALIHEFPERAAHRIDEFRLRIQRMPVLMEASGGTEQPHKVSLIVT